MRYFHYTERGKRTLTEGVPDIGGGDGRVGFGFGLLPVGVLDTKREHERARCFLLVQEGHWPSQPPRQPPAALCTASML